METQLINNFATVAFCAFRDFGTSSEGDDKQSKSTANNQIKDKKHKTS